MQLTSLLAAGLLCLSGLTSVHATTTAVLPNGAWSTFDVIDPQLGLGNNDLSWVDLNDGSKLSFTFAIGAGQVGTLTVVDAGFAGDVFSVMANGSPLANTSAAVNSYPVALNFDDALANANFSRGVYTFGPGNYTVTGALFSSAPDDAGAVLNATVGAVRLDVSPVPEASPLTMLMAGLSVLGVVASRRRVQ